MPEVGQLFVRRLGYVRKKTCGRYDLMTEIQKNGSIFFTDCPQSESKMEKSRFHNNMSLKVAQEIRTLGYFEINLSHHTSPESRTL